MNQKKLFVLDTNVLLHDYKCIYQFEENDIMLPITVLEELDKFKKGNDQINFQAREFARELDQLAGEFLFTEGISLGRGLGRLFIETGKPFSREMEESFEEKIADHRILAIADYARNSNPDKQVILVTKDINLRIKAKALGLQAQDYKAGQVTNLEYLYEGIPTIENQNDEAINKLYTSPEGVSIEEFDLGMDPIANQYMILKGNNSSVLAIFDIRTSALHVVQKQRCYGIEPRNAEQTMTLDALMRPDIQLVSLTGKAGTGKTLLALAAALQQRRDYLQVYLARPIIPLGNRDIGYLPGDAGQKIEPYMQPLFDNLSVIKHQFDARSKEYTKIDQLLEDEKLIITPLAYIRGRSLSKVFFIVDEAQNLTPHEVKTIITRAGEGTKIVFTGDIHQIDSPYLDTKSNGLSYFTEKMKGQDIFAHVNLVQGVRSHLAELASNLL
ncbi:MAG: PhoH family protein [Bacteroidales bacterium]|jgi:PhoH-like ATPase|nr:PhoH family protein [Bacteroidales bacterium]MDD2570751.1 PhoH family protein [Bacteroidales bacterium]MDD3385253.1 PhoH family protein [Bacteroidales bacterium]MDD3871471.1 PhoH family protein [Bacteroidales bacterium]MDD4812727.1 PhoH family protein [Bacteroidales bacterium]